MCWRRRVDRPDARRARIRRFCAGVCGVRVARADSQRQRASVREPGGLAALVAVSGLVAPLGDSSGTHPAGPSGTKRGARAVSRVLKAETTRPPARTAAAQQRRFGRFRCKYNEDRPHQALDHTTPAMHYRPSPRGLPARLPGFDYLGHFEVRRVSSNGCVAWHQRVLFLGRALAGHDIGFDEIVDGSGPCRLARSGWRTSMRARTSSRRCHGDGSRRPPLAGSRPRASPRRALGAQSLAPARRNLNHLLPMSSEICVTYVSETPLSAFSFQLSAQNHAQ